MNIRHRWEQSLSTAREMSQRSKYVSNFKPLPSEQAKRASYFTEMSKLIDQLGLKNPHEKSALSIEPTHPVPSKFIGGSIDKLNLDPSICTSYHQYKLSLLSIPMLEKYSPLGDAKHIAKSKYMAPLHLLDPLYGFAFFREDNRIRNHCFAIDIWQTHLSTMPKLLAQQLWENRADSMLSGGALAGRLVFKDTVPPTKDNIERSTVAEICISTESELLALIECLQSQAENHNGVELWFRGQNEEFLTPDRLRLTELGIAPYSNIREADLTPSLYRNYDAHLDSFDSFEQIILELAEWVYYANQLAPQSQGDRFVPPAKGAAAVTRAGINSYQRGLILQQYGAPSAYLDITRDPSIAAWFATHSCSNNSDQRMMYQNYQWHGDDSENWPTIFVFPLVKGLHPYLDLESILKDSNALRPKRQKCGLLGGAGNLARNYCSRYIDLKIRLKPGFKLSTSLEPSTLFPPSSEDSILAYLKDAGLGDTKRLFHLSELA